MALWYNSSQMGHLIECLTLLWIVVRVVANDVFALQNGAEGTVQTEIKGYVSRFPDGLATTDKMWSWMGQQAPVWGDDLEVGMQVLFQLSIPTANTQDT